jgi:hypothetical protein
MNADIQSGSSYVRVKITAVEDSDASSRTTALSWRGLRPSDPERYAGGNISSWWSHQGQTG